MGSTEVQPIADNFAERCKAPPKMQFKGGGEVQPIAEKI